MSISSVLRPQLASYSPPIATLLPFGDAGTGALQTLGMALTENANRNVRLWHILLSNVLKSPRKKGKIEAVQRCVFPVFQALSKPMSARHRTGIMSPKSTYLEV